MEDPSPLTPPRRRQFGTLLSDKTNSPHRASTSSSVKKTGVRRGAVFSPLVETSAASIPRDYTYTVTFEGGPIGLQLEPIVVSSSSSSEGSKNTGSVTDNNNSSNQYYCRVQRFVDDGPNDPGQARKAGTILPNDVVLAVNGITITSYKQAIQILKQHCNEKREIHFGRFDCSRNSNPITSSTVPTQEDKQTLKQKKKPSPLSLVTVTTATAAASTLSSRSQRSSATNNQQVKPGFLRKTPRTPQTPESGDDNDYHDTSQDVSTPETSNVKHRGALKEEVVQQTAPPPPLPSFDIRNEREGEATKELTLSISPSKKAHQQQPPSEDKLSLAEIRAELEQERRQKEHLQESLHQLQQEHEESQKNSSRQLDNTRDQLNEQTLCLEQELILLKRKNQASDEKLHSLEEEKRELQQRLCDTKKELDTAASSRADADRLAHQQVQAERQRALQLEQASKALQDKVNVLERCEKELHSLKSTAASQVDVFRQENKKLREQLEQSRNEVAKVVSPSIRVSARVCALEDAKASLESQLAHEKERAQAALDESSVLQRSIREKDATILRLEKQAKATGEFIAGLRSELSLQETSRSATEATLEQVKADKASSERESAWLKDENVCLQAELEQAKDQLSEMLESRNPSEIERLHAELASKGQDIKDSAIAVDRLQREKESLSLRIFDLESSAKEAKNEQLALRSLLDQARSELQTSTESGTRGQLERLHSLNYRAEKAERLFKDKENQLAQTKSHLDKANATIEKLSSDLKQTDAELSKANSKVDSLEREQKEFILREKRRNTELEGQITTKFHEASVLSKAKIAEARTEISELQRQVRTLEGSKRSCKREIDSLTKANVELTSKVDRLEKAIDDKDNKLSAKTVECMTSINLLEDARDELTQKTDEHNACKRALETVQAQYWELNTRLSHVAEESSKEIDSLQSDFHGVKEELVDSTARCTELERLLRSIRRSASDSEARLSQTRELLDRERVAAREAKKSAEASCVALIDKLESTTKQVTQLKHMSHDLEKERDLFRAEVGALEKKIGSLTEEITSLKERLGLSVDESMREKERLLAELSLEREKARELSENQHTAELFFEQQLKEKESQVQRCEERLRFARVEAESKARKHEEVLRSKESELRGFFQIQEDLSNARSEIARFEESLRRSKEESEQLTALLDEVRKDHAQKMQQLTNCHGQEIERLSEEKGQLERTLRKNDARREDAETRLYSAEEGLLAARSERERLITEKNSLVNSLHRAEDSLSELRGELQALQSASDCSTDSSETEFTGLSRSDLKVRCISLQGELQHASRCATDSSSSVTQRDQQLKRLEEVLELLTAETEKLVQTNGMYEDRYKEARVSVEEAGATASETRARLAIEEERVKSLELQLVDQVDRNSSLSDKLRSAEEKIRSVDSDFAAREEELCNEVAVLKQLLAEAEADNTTSAEDLQKKEDEVSRAEQRLKETQSLVSRLDAELGDTKNELSKAFQLVDSIKTETAGAKRRYANQIASLENECADLRARMAELEVELDATRVELQGQSEGERALAEKLGKQRQEVLEKEALREEIVAKLAQASRVVASQMETITAHEHRAAEAERTATSLSSQIVQLQETISKMESSSEFTGDFRLKQLQELEEKCTALEKERSDVRAESNELRDELRQARRRASDYEKINGSLTSRAGATKEAYDKTKIQLIEARSALEESALSSKKLQDELETKRMEADHLKARVQLLNASVARLRSDHLLLKEAALHAEFQLAATDSNDAKISQLKAEIKAKTSKLESLSEVYHSQQQVLAMSQSLEEQLLHFIADMICQVAGAFNKISSLTGVQGNAYRAELPLELRALALAGIEWPDSKFKCGSSSMDGLSAVIPTVLADLEAKRNQLSTLKKQRKARSLSKAATPEPKTKKPALPDTPTIMEALHSIKRVLNEEVLSPEKRQNNSLGRLDCEYFHKVVHSLESQIDGLLVDLQCANTALQAKDQLFSDLEHLVAHHEMERDRLERKLVSRSALLRDMDGKLKKELTWKRAAKEELALVREQLKKKENVTSNDNGAAAKAAAGRMIANFLVARAKTRKANAFRHWICNDSATRAAQQQRQLTTELSHQLDSTREKLGILKNHLKKSRRGHLQESGLDRICEGYETT